MKPIKFYTSLVFIFFLITIFSFDIDAQNSSESIWIDVSSEEIEVKGRRDIIPSKYRSIRLNREELELVLATAPMEFTSAGKKSKAILTFPMPDGSVDKFRIVESPIIDKELLAIYPSLKTYAGQGIENPTATIRFDLLPNGFHAMVRSNEGIFFIDPYSQGDVENYISYNVADHTHSETFSCHTEHHDHNHEKENEIAAQATAIQSSAGQAVGENLRTYRIAIAATGEYTLFHGGTVNDGMAAIVTALNRINEVFETEVATRLLLVAGNDALVYTDSLTDPYTNHNLNTILGENQTNIPNIIGIDNFDIGHVFGTQGGGLAGVGVVCNNNAKAWGGTGITNPVGDFFSVVYVCHEIGHQFNAPHTFNSCQGEGGSATAFEPGSGTTIMAYAGLCGTDNIQFNTDPHFHTGSYERMVNAGNSCAVLVSTGNNAPIVETTDPDGLTLPIGTPFILTGNATDPDEDALTYSWEEVDLGPISSLGNPTSSAPLFRSFAPVEVPYRIFPKLTDILNNTSDDAEMLPTYARDLNFRLTARDNRMGGGGVHYDSYEIEVTDQAGPFLVMEPNTNVDWVVGETETITWDVANTDQAPVSCSQVNILLSTDGGYTYPVTLANDVANSGTASIQVPNNIGVNNRVKVECANNVFFDISNTEFSIVEPLTASFVVQSSPSNQDLCSDENAVYMLDLSSLAGFNEQVSFTAAGLPAGASASFSPNTIVPTGAVEMTISNLQNSNSGSYNITVSASSNSLNIDTDVTLELFNGAPSEVQTLGPVSGTMNVSQGIALTWDAMSDASNYIIELSTTPDFSNPIETATVASTSYTPQNYTDYTIYYWRVKATNLCGEGVYSDMFAYQTKQSPCLTYTAADTPVSISDGPPSTVTSTIAVPDDFTITDFNINNLNGSHSYLGDLLVYVTSPNGTAITLMQQICGSDDDFDLSLDDDAGTTIPCPATDGGTHQPAGNLSSINGESSSGDWVLTIQDGFNNDGGNLTGWQVELCRDVEIVEQPSLIRNELLTVADGELGTVSNNLLSVTSTMNTADLIEIKLLSLPQYGSIQRNNVTLGLGDQFTQADIDNNMITYVHSVSGTTSDQFDFDVLTENGGWINGNTFLINIVNSVLSASAVQNNGPSCFNSSDAQVTVLATGGTAPYEYSIDGTNYQNGNQFMGLAAGSYTFSIKDAENNVITTNPIVIENPNQINVSTAVMADMVTGTAAGGTGMMSYSLDGVSFQQSNIFENLSPGAYTLFVKDENDCEANVVFTIQANTLVVSANIVSDLDCHDGDNASIMVNSNGGTPPYEYSLDGVDYQTSNLFSGLAAGNYSFYIRDAQTFVMETTVISVSNPSPINIITDVIGDGITINAVGGNAPYEYSLDGINFQSDNHFGNLGGGQYTVTVKDANGCENTVTTNVSPNTLTALAILDQNISCFGETDGRILVAAQQGTPPYEYSLDGVNYQSNNTFTNLTAGNYIVTIKDFQGFTREANMVVITEPSQITVTPLLNANVLSVNASGGTGSLTYSLDGVNYQSENVFSFLANGMYTIYVKDANDCTSEATETVTGNSVAAAATVQQNPCFDENNGMLGVTVSGGNSPFTYSLDGINFQSENIFTNLAAGSYEVIVRDNAGFVNKTNLVNLAQGNEIIIGATINEDDVLINASGGAGNFEYSLDGVNYQSESLFGDLPSGDYTAYARDVNGCIATQTFNVTLVGINDLYSNLYFNVYPNPGNGILTIELNQPTEKRLSVSIFDSAGKLVFNDVILKNTDEFKTTIEANHLAGGVYQLRIGDGIYFGIKRLVILK